MYSALCQASLNYRTSWPKQSTSEKQGKEGEMMTPLLWCTSKANQSFTDNGSCPEPFERMQFGGGNGRNVMEFFNFVMMVCRISQLHKRRHFRIHEFKKPCVLP
jgi:hypothetical protein